MRLTAKELSLYQFNGRIPRQLAPRPQYTLWWVLIAVTLGCVLLAWRREFYSAGIAIKNYRWAREEEFDRELHELQVRHAMDPWGPTPIWTDSSPFGDSHTPFPQSELTGQ